MEISNSDYKVWSDDETNTFYFEGSMRLAGTPEYAPVSDQLVAAVDANPNDLVFDLTQLQFLNSSGINMFAKVTIAIRKKQNINFTIRGSQSIPWQGKSLPNLKKLYPALNLEYV